MAGETIVIKKKRKGHGGHHGGAWKVAYADFVTAMMAFFLVMWLVGQSKAIKAGVAGYFRDPGAFEKQGGKGILPGGQDVSQSGPSTPAVDTERKALEQSVAHIKERINNVPEFKALRNQVEFSITAEGLRIDLLESSGASFFDNGSAGMKPEAEHLLGIIAHELGTLDNAIVIEGHTDSRPYTNSDKYTNWELSADRANAARRTMERGGLKPTQIVGVRGQADRDLKVAEDPLDPRNRRVSVLVKSHGA